MAFIDQPETTEFLQRLQQGLKEPTSRELVFHAYGKGGIGKTTLLKQIRETFPKVGIAAVSFGLDSGTESPLELMAKLYGQLPAIGEWGEEFTDQYQEYEELCAAIEQTEEGKTALKIAQNLGQAVLPKIVGEPLKHGTQGILESEDSVGKLNDFLRKFRGTKGKPELQKLVREPLPILTAAFVKGLRAKAQQQTILLLLDT